MQRSTGEYKIKPIKKQVRALLGYPYPRHVPKDVFVEQWVGISTDELHRAKDADVAYMRNRHPLIQDLDWSRADCLCYLTQRGLAGAPKSSRLGCPFHGNAQWRHIRDHSSAERDDVVAFDAAIRDGNARANACGNRLLGQAFLHRSRVPARCPALPLPPPCRVRPVTRSWPRSAPCWHVQSHSPRACGGCAGCSPTTSPCPGTGNISSA
ncbi:hypothetical protein [Streptomyces sp. NPDC018045]|uniref:hypothetical protein n=1 Tax=Streptomyces sp. NPDC018045 TaxID=3365037 RepID=UPI003795DB09